MSTCDGWFMWISTKQICFNSKTTEPSVHMHGSFQEIVFLALFPIEKLTCGRKLKQGPKHASMLPRHLIATNMAHEILWEETQATSRRVASARSGEIGDLYEHAPLRQRGTCLQNAPWTQPAGRESQPCWDGGRRHSYFSFVFRLVDLDTADAAAVIRRPRAHPIATREVKQLPQS